MQKIKTQDPKYAKNREKYAKKYAKYAKHAKPANICKKNAKIYKNMPFMYGIYLAYTCKICTGDFADAEPGAAAAVPPSGPGPGPRRWPPSQASTGSDCSVFGIFTSITLVRSTQSSSAASSASDGYGRAGTRSCGPGPGPPVYDYHRRVTPSHCLGRIHHPSVCPIRVVMACSTTGTDWEQSGMDERPKTKLVMNCVRYVTIS